MTLKFEKLVMTTSQLLALSRRRWCRHDHASSYVCLSWRRRVSAASASSAAADVHPGARTRFIAGTGAPRDLAEPKRTRQVCPGAGKKEDTLGRFFHFCREISSFSDNELCRAAFWLVFQSLDLQYDNERSRSAAGVTSQSNQSTNQ